MFCDYSGKLVLITGGTRGIGLATGLAFARQGAQVVLTCRWGGDDETALYQRFADEGLPAPSVFQADISSTDDTDALMQHLRSFGLPLDVFVNNATGAVSVGSLDDLTERALMSSLRYGVWPVVEYLKKIREALGAWPRYVVSMSTTGIDSYTRNYDLVATSKAALEAMCRYLSYHLRNEDCRINVVRTRAIPTESVKAVIGDDLDAIAAKAGNAAHLLTPDEVAGSILALCSGYLDGMNGQVLTVDRGGLFADNISRLVDQREELGL